MIYTIGHRENYLKAIAIYGTILKGIGGYAFQTFEDASRRIEELKKQKEWVVWGLDANWETDTQPDEDGGWWRVLARTSHIIPLDQNESSSTPVPDRNYYLDLYEEDVPDNLPEYPEPILFCSSDEPSKLETFLLCLLILTIFLGIVFILLRGW